MYPQRYTVPAAPTARRPGTGSIGMQTFGRLSGSTTRSSPPSQSQHFRVDVTRSFSNYPLIKVASISSEIHVPRPSGTLRNLEPHSKIKHEILRQYFNASLPTMASGSRGVETRARMTAREHWRNPLLWEVVV